MGDEQQTTVQTITLGVVVVALIGMMGVVLIYTV
jgi:hypothetical protein